MEKIEGYSVSFKKPKCGELFNIGVECTTVIEASKKAQEWMKMQGKREYNEYGISKLFFTYPFSPRKEGLNVMLYNKL